MLMFFINEAQIYTNTVCTQILMLIHKKPSFIEKNGGLGVKKG